MIRGEHGRAERNRARERGVQCVAQAVLSTSSSNSLPLAVSATRTSSSPPKVAVQGVASEAALRLPHVSMPDGVAVEGCPSVWSGWFRQDDVRHALGGLRLHPVVDRRTHLAARWAVRDRL